MLEMKNTLDGIISRLEVAEEENRKIEDRNIKLSKEEFLMKKSFNELWDNFNWSDIVGVPKS